MTGALIQKTERQPRAESSAPPTAGPAAMLSPNTDAQTPIARARSRRSGIAFTTIAKATGLSIEAPAPCTTRAATSTPADGDTAHARDAPPNTSKPNWKTLRRPKRSATAPEEISKLARTRV